MHMRCDSTERRIAHVVHEVAAHHFARSDDANAALVEAAFIALGVLLEARVGC